MLNCYLVLSHCFCTKYPTQTDFHASSKSEVVAYAICRTHSRVNVRSEKWACNQTTLTSTHSRVSVRSEKWACNQTTLISTHSRVNVRSEKMACNQTTLTSATILMCSSCNATLGFKMSQGLKSSRFKYLVA